MVGTGTKYASQYDTWYQRCKWYLCKVFMSTTIHTCDLPFGFKAPLLEGETIGKFVLDMNQTGECRHKAVWRMNFTVALPAILGLINTVFAILS